MTDTRIALCKSCKASIIWLKTTAGSNMPTDSTSVGPDDKVFDLKKGHVSHWATCPTSDYHRKPCKPRSKA